MDGNGRWAKSKGLPRNLGHKKGADSVKTAIDAALKYGIKYLTLYSFSLENWSRPKEEVDSLMDLLRQYLNKETKDLISKGISLRFIGDIKRLPEDIILKIQKIEEETKDFDNLTLILALSYSGREEILSAAKRLSEDVVLKGLKIESIDEVKFANYLYTKGIPEPELLIRTGGEQRISNFLLWQMAYTEFVFLECFWPDFKEEDFNYSLEEFAKRQRRFGGL